MGYNSVLGVKNVKNYFMLQRFQYVLVSNIPLLAW